MRLEEAIGRFLGHLEALNYSPKTLLGYRQDLFGLAAHLAALTNQDEALVDDLTPLRVESFVAKPDSRGNRVSPTYRNRRLSVIRSFCRFLEKQGILEEATEFATAISFSRLPRTEPSFLSYDEYLQILGTVGYTVSPTLRSRNWAIIVTLYNSGLRLAELVGLEVSQFDEKEALFIGLKRKGGIKRDLPINQNVVHSIAAWLLVRGYSEGPLFTGRNNGRLSDRTIQRMVVRYAKEAGLLKPVSPHTLRHSFCTEVQRRHASIATAKVLMDHRSIKTTARYSHSDDESMRLAIEALNDPSTWPREDLGAITRQERKAA